MIVMTERLVSDQREIHEFTSVVSFHAPDKPDGNQREIHELSSNTALVEWSITRKDQRKLFDRYQST